MRLFKRKTELKPFGPVPEGMRELAADELKEVGGAWGWGGWSYAVRSNWGYTPSYQSFYGRRY